MDISVLLSSELDEIKHKFYSTIITSWNECIQKYIHVMEQMYTNWNAGRTADGDRQTYEYNFNRKSTVAY